ncbi:MAG: redoxin domain-containing protein [Planctomycetia bacterium]|nr:redoxin domain-containing protein [Planctomycetia bacterium]
MLACYHRGSLLGALFCGFLALSPLAFIGCNDAAPRDLEIAKAGVTSAAKKGDPAQSPEVIKAQAVLNQLAATYRDAKTYADSGTVRLLYEQGERKVDEAVDFAVTLEKPNKLRLNLYQALVVSDGEKFRATIADLAGEVLEVDAPAALTLEEIYRHELLNGVLTGGLAGSSPQLAFLLNDKAVEQLVELGSAPPRLMSPGEIDGEPCDRVVIERTDGQLLLWIDQKTHVLRRLEYPVTELAKQMSQAGAVSNLTLVADFAGAQVNAPVDAVAFQFETPEGAKLVDSFVSHIEMPRPEPPSPLLGKPAPEFAFYTLDGRRVTKESLAGKVAVLDFWFTTCEPCQATMPLVQRVFEEYAQDDRVQFFAVSIADPAGGNLELQKVLQGWQVKLPIVRDVDKCFENAFEIPGAPALYVLGPDGRVQDYHAGLNSNLAEELSQSLQKLLAGQDTFNDVQKRYEVQMAEYQKAQTASSGSESATQELPDAEIAPRSEPQTVKLTKLWTAKAVKEPGNVLVTRDGDATAKIYALDGWRQVVELDAKGELVERHLLELPEEAVVRYLRTAVDSAGQRVFAGSASAQQQAHVFDSAWKTKFSYPSLEGGKSDGLTDVQFGDLNADGQPELNVAFWGAGGVHNVALDGTRAWNNQSLELVYRLAVTSPDASGQRSLLTTNRQGTLVALAHDGQPSEHHSVGTRYLHAVFTADLNGDGNVEICAIARDQANHESLVGIAPDFTAQWELPLPFGWQRHPIDAVTSGKVLPGEESQWIIAGADGSIQLISREGQVLDRFHHGAALAGLAATEIVGKPALVIATASGVEAWGVEAK